MFEKPFLACGTLGLALAASVFIGCQDFLGGEKGVPSATDADMQHAAQEVASRDSAKDMPAQAMCGTQPAAAPVNGTPPAADILPVCQDLFAQMKGAQDPLYGELKDKFVALGCTDILLAAGPIPTPPPPPDSATVCANLRSGLATLPPGDPKYPSYQEELAKYCGEAVPAKPAPAEPAKPAPAPASTALAPEQQVCLELYKELQTAKEPRYGEVKNLYGSQDCEAVLGDQKPAPAPVVPLSLEERCRMYRYNVVHTTPSPQDAKYQAYMAQEAIACADYP